VDPKTRLVETVRLFEALELFDMNGHVSMRTEDGFYIHGRQASRAALTIDDIVKVRLDGTVIAGSQEPPNEVLIHSEIYRVRPDVQAVAHFHGKWNQVLSVARIPFRPVSTVACGLGDTIPIFEAPDSISTLERGQAVARTLGEHRILLLRAHGAIVTGKSLEEVLVAAKYLEMNAEKQIFVQLLNSDARLTNEEIQNIGESLWIPKNIQKTWLYYYEKARQAGKFAGIIPV
jgi:ribulose-5-phosphate 4-epimerase/fuculose-1-phosphate aldolase